MWQKKHIIILKGSPKRETLVVPVIQLLPGVIFPYKAITVDLN